MISKNVEIAKTKTKTLATHECSGKKDLFIIYKVNTGFKSLLTI